MFAPVAAAKSSLPSALKSPVASELGSTGRAVRRSKKMAVGVVCVTSKKDTLEEPPPGAGLTTVTRAVVGVLDLIEALLQST